MISSDGDVPTTEEKRRKNMLVGEIICQIILKLIYGPFWEETERVGEKKKKRPPKKGDHRQSSCMTK